MAEAIASGSDGVSPPGPVPVAGALASARQTGVFNGDGGGDIAALAKGGRTNFYGFLIRLVARIPFLFIASRLYGASALGRFASALVMVEFAGQMATLGQKRGLAQRLSETAWPETDHLTDAQTPGAQQSYVQDPDAPVHAVADALLVTMVLASAMSVLIWLFPESMYPKGNFSQAERLLVLSVWMMAVGDIALAALAFRFDVATTVRARAVVEPWTLSITAGVAYFVYPEGGLALAYLASVGAATGVALVALVRAYGLPRRWRPRPLPQPLNPQAVEPSAAAVAAGDPQYAAGWRRCGRMGHAQDRRVYPAVFYRRGAAGDLLFCPAIRVAAAETENQF